MDLHNLDFFKLCHTRQSPLERGGAVGHKGRLQSLGGARPAVGKWELNLGVEHLLNGGALDILDGHNTRLDDLNGGGPCAVATGHV